jgi:hypothetical protein
MRFEVLSDCPECLVESALLEAYDEAFAACRLGMAAEASCRLCGARFQGDTAADDSPFKPSGCPACGKMLPDDIEKHHSCPACGLVATRAVVEAPVDLSDRGVLEARLLAWATTEGAQTVDEFLDASFLGVSLDDLAGKIRAKERVETSFDVFFHLFGHAALSGAGGVVQRRKAPAPPPPPPPERIPSRPPPTPRAFLYPIVSVMVADGEIKDVEKEFIDRILETEGHAPLLPEEIRVHRPAEIAREVPAARRHEAVELMVQLAAVDGETDLQEIRIAKAYASAWGVPTALVNEWVERYKERHTTGVRRFFRKLRSFFFVDVAEEAAAAS